MELETVICNQIINKDPVLRLNIHEDLNSVTFDLDNFDLNKESQSGPDAPHVSSFFLFRRQRRVERTEIKKNI